MADRWFDDLFSGAITIVQVKITGFVMGTIVLYMLHIPKTKFDLLSRIVVGNVVAFVGTTPLMRLCGWQPDDMPLVLLTASFLVAFGWSLVMLLVRHFEQHPTLSGNIVNLYNILKNRN